MKRWLAALILGFAVAAAGCSDGLLISGYGDERQPGGLDESTVQIGSADFLDHPEGAEGLPVFGVDISLWSGEITDEEVGCWYDEGVRHVIAGTQNPRVTLQQLDQALEGGMSVDAYIYIHWDEDIAEEVKHDVELLKDYPIGRLWLDIEAAPDGRTPTQLAAKIREGLDACGEMPCGIYTAAWWWEPHMRNSDEFADVPVWYAYYDRDPSMQTWATQSFGGWDMPWGKQWNEIYFCGIDVDKNTIFTTSDPVSSPKSFEPTGEEANAPTGLYPDEMVKIRREQVRALVDAEPDADEYTFEVQHYRSGNWLSYYTFGASSPAIRFSATIRDRVYRFRVKAIGNGGASDWSKWAYFEVGNASEIPDIAPQTDEETTEPDEETTEPDEETTEPDEETTEPDEETTQPDPVAGAPAGLSPEFGANFDGGGVTLSCDAVTDATTYEWEIQNWYDVTSDWSAYYTYTTSAESRRFFPAGDLAYRWRVRAQTDAGWTPFTNWQTFTVGDASLPTPR
jgi:hypothetical protein